MTWPAHNPRETVDYIELWSDRLEDDTIATSTFDLVDAAGLTKVSESNTTTTATIKLSGGTPGLVATIRNTIVTAGARTYEALETLVISGLTVENGTGLADADALIALAYADTYHAKRGNTAWASKSVGDRESAIRRASSWLSSSAFGWGGCRLTGRTQGLAFPRLYMLDRAGELVPSNAVPIEVQQACCEAALFEVVTPGGLTPAVQLTDRVKSKAIGPMRKEFFAPSNDPEAARPVLLIVRDLIGGLLASSGNLLAGTAVRG